YRRPSFWDAERTAQPAGPEKRDQIRPQPPYSRQLLQPPDRRLCLRRERASNQDSIATSDIHVYAATVPPSGNQPPSSIGRTRRSPRHVCSSMSCIDPLPSNTYDCSTSVPALS